MEEVAARGLGLVGCVPFLMDLWFRHAPSNWKEARTTTLAQQPGTDKKLTVMLRKLAKA